MSEDVDEGVCGERREDVGKAIGAFNRMPDVVPVAGKYAGRPPQSTLDEIAAWREQED